MTTAERQRLQFLEDAEATRILTLDAILERERVKGVEAEVVWGMMGGGKAKVVHRIRSMRDPRHQFDVYVKFWCGAVGVGRPNNPPPVLMRSRPEGVPMCRTCAAREHRWMEQPAFRVLIDEQGNAV